MMNRKALLDIDSKILTYLSVSVLAILVLSLGSGAYAFKYNFKD